LGDASCHTLPFAANHASLPANGTMWPSAYQTRALVAHWIHASHGYSGVHTMSSRSSANRTASQATSANQSARIAGDIDALLRSSANTTPR
jgi:hypothetical protein